MFKNIKAFFQEQIVPASNEKGQTQEHALQLATAALLIEMTHADFKVKDEERQAVSAAIQTAFQLTAEETQSLITLIGCPTMFKIYLSPKTLLHELPNNVPSKVSSNIS